MSARELVARSTGKAFTAFERWQHHRGTLSAPDRLERALTTEVVGARWQARLLASRRDTGARFFPGAHDPSAMRRLFTGPYVDELRHTLRQAARARDNRFEFFGQEFHFPDAIHWQADPVSSREWPAVYHADVPVHGGDVGYGDVKYVWELNRQQYLIDLAKAVYLTGAEEDLLTIRRLVRSWIAGNPYGTGVNWSCALEPAFRVWSWLWAYHLTSEVLDDEFHLEWLRAFYDHGRFLAGHLEHYTSPYNHLIGEAAALYAVGVCFPEFRASPKWRRQGRFVLESRLRDQYYADGGSVEQSLFYHHATTGFYILAALLGRANGEEFSPEVYGAIERAIEFSMQLAQPDGRTPAIGGADDGKPIRMEHLPFWDFRPYQAIGAVMFQRPDFKWVAGRFYEDALWLLGATGLDAFAALESRSPRRTSVVLEASGYAMARSGWSRDADYVCMDVGEQAAGMRTDGVPNSMHGHADCLSVIVSLAGKRVLVDSGLYAYNCGGPWEAHFRETAAHSTARIDGRDQARHIGKMAWSHSYRAVIENHGECWTAGSHDGFARGPRGVTHRRTVWLRRGYVLVHDEFRGAGDHAIDVNYQFAPGALRLTGSGTAMFDGFAQLAWAGDAQWNAAARCGGPGPADGWICSSLGVRRAAPRLTLAAAMSGNRTSLLTVIARSPFHARVVSREGLRLISIEDAEGVDWIAAAGLPTGAVIHTDARLAVCRLTSDRMERSLVLGTHLRCDRERLERLCHSLVPAEELR